jgi:hypothetical protein
LHHEPLTYDSCIAWYCNYVMIYTVYHT